MLSGPGGPAEPRPARVSAGLGYRGNETVVIVVLHAPGDRGPVAAGLDRDQAERLRAQLDAAIAELRAGRVGLLGQAERRTAAVEDELARRLGDPANPDHPA